MYPIRGATPKSVVFDVSALTAAPFTVCSVVAPVDVEEPAVELALAEQVGDRLAGQPSFQQVLEPGGLRRLHRPLRVGEDLRLGETEHRSQEEAGLAGRGAERGRRQPRSRAGQERGDGRLGGHRGSL